VQSTALAEPSDTGPSLERIARLTPSGMMHDQRRLDHGTRRRIMPGFSKPSAGKKLNEDTRLRFFGRRRVAGRRDPDGEVGGFGKQRHVALP
jgi:hypothetical protein